MQTEGDYERGGGRAEKERSFAVGQNYVGTWYCFSNLIFITISGDTIYK